MKIKIFFFIIIFLWLFYYFGIISSTVGYTSIKFPTKIKATLFQTTPQGWGFFTKSPRDEFMMIYKKSNQDLDLLTKHFFTYHNTYGLSRKQRILHMQMAQALNSTTSKQWNSCNKKDPLDCDYSEIVNVEYENPLSLLSGKYLVKRTKHIPWAWSRKKESLKNPYKIIYINVE